MLYRVIGYLVAFIITTIGVIITIACSYFMYSLACFLLFALLYPIGTQFLSSFDFWKVFEYVLIIEFVCVAIYSVWSYYFKFDSFKK